VSLRAKEREKEIETTTFHNIGDGAYDGGEKNNQCFKIFQDLTVA